MEPTCLFNPVLRVLASAALGCASLAFAGNSRAKAARFFDDQVAPIFVKNCLTCHNHELDDAGISFENSATLLQERTSGRRAVVPGKPQQSALIRAIRHDGDVQMPPGKKLSAHDIATLTKWIKQGAPWGTRLRGPGPPP